MKKLSIILSALLILASCSDGKQTSVEDVIASQDLEQIRLKKTELDQKQAEIASELKLLESEIKKLDPQEKIPLITTFTVSEQVFNHYLDTIITCIQSSSVFFIIRRGTG